MHAGDDSDQESFDASDSCESSDQEFRIAYDTQRASTVGSSARLDALARLDEMPETLNQLVALRCLNERPINTYRIARAG